LENFLQINETSYFNLVQTFYAKLSLDENNVIHSRADSVDVSLSIDHIAHILPTFFPS